MDTTIVVALIAMFQALGVAVIAGLMQRSRADNEAYRSKREEAEKKASEEAEERAKERAKKRLEFDLALLELNFACSKGTELLLEHAHGEELNGNVTKALAAIDNARAAVIKIINEEGMKLKQ